MPHAMATPGSTSKFIAECPWPKAKIMYERRVIPPQSKWKVLEGLQFNPIDEASTLAAKKTAIHMCLLFLKVQHSPLEFASLPLNLLGFELLEDGISNKCHLLWL